MALALQNNYEPQMSWPKQEACNEEVGEGVMEDGTIHLSSWRV